ncbi:hypothetical protein G432_05000 [Sphingomonas sp. MM-1]|uniref:hypothetical protein n=1 Tax=Sphingomonas sp. MM-1 TaxID=745310 RepID=UPI0002C14D9E|nr:hypothetical protein [Sphingomonas sp. MM-1]AGH48727.1 hypothetical protein G432_05000 [Sphingomonas sp. MM-1]
MDEIAKIAAGLSEAEVNALLAFSLTGSAGTIEAKPGDRFIWWDGTEWEIIGLTEGWDYSPAGLGGCPSVALRLVGGDADPITRRFMDGDISVWCGDSVASGLIRSRKDVHLMKDEGR